MEEQTLFSEDDNRSFLGNLRRSPKFWPALIATAALFFTILFLFRRSVQSENTSYLTAALERGDLTVTISATGTLEPEEVVDVGAQVAGQIASFGFDIAGKTIDYGSEVESGAVLAQIDDSLFRSDVLDAEAQVKQAQANLIEAQAKNFQADRDWRRAQKLGPSKVLAQTTYDAYESTFRSTQAGVAVAEAQITQAEAQVTRAKRNLAFTTIRSPVRGVIIDRRVDIGQTVVSSLNAPSLFLIAKDLRQLEIWVSVNEADISNIHPDQEVQFSVDARPGEVFKGTVSKVRLNASMTQNVVTYVVEVRTANPDNRLLPYLTANARFQINNFKNELLVPNAALRWSPKSTEASTPSTSGKDSTIWVEVDGAPKRIPVQTLGSDGTRTAIRVDSTSLPEGAFVIIGERLASDGESTSSSNPFAPPRMRGNRR